MPSKSVLIAGGGLAGLAAASALSDAGLRVALLEKRPHLGGRATSYTLPDGAEVDNCQHVTLGCCTNLSDFYRRVGAAQKIRWFDTLYFADRTGRRSSIGASALPAPFHLSLAFARFNLLDFRSKRRIAAALFAIARAGGRPADASGSTMLDWLRRHAQTDAAIARFWRVVLVSALNEQLDRADAQFGVDVFWKGFLANRTGFRMGVPGVPLAELYDGCLAVIERQGGEVRLRAGAGALRFRDDRVAALVLEDGSERIADFYLLALPHQAALGLLPAAVRERDPVLRAAAGLADSPITGIHLWFDRQVMALPHLTLVDQTIQWVFNKSAVFEDRSERARRAPAIDGAGRGQYLQLVVSASRDLVPRSRQEIIDLARRELAEVLPETRAANLLKSTVIKETAATFSPVPGSDSLRPGQASPVDNLFLAGDWTATRWPGTMEGAVRSGYLAAGAILRRLGISKNVLVPDLPAEGLAARWAAKNAG